MSGLPDRWTEDRCYGNVSQLGSAWLLTRRSAIFFTFTFLMMLPTHVYLILVGRSTIESFQTGDQMRAEEAALKMEFNNPNCPTKEIRAVRKEWKAEYGGVAVNDRWRVGRLRDRWRREMGDRWIGWIRKWRRWGRADRVSARGAASWRRHSLPTEPAIRSPWRVAANERMAT